MTPAGTTIGSIFVGLRYHDAPRMIQWLHDAFGFETVARFDGPDGSVAHSELQLGTGMIMVGSARDDEFRTLGPQQAGGVTHLIYCWVPDADAHCRRARTAGAEIVREPADTHYDSREYAARDPEGYVWSFGTYMPAARGE
jgi:uncharacterized glyoxalase superfamily protein PhnB